MIFLCFGKNVISAYNMQCILSESNVHIVVVALAVNISLNAIKQIINMDHTFSEFFGKGIGNEIEILQNITFFYKMRVEFLVKL